MIEQSTGFAASAFNGGRIAWLDQGPSAAYVAVYGTARPSGGGAPGGAPLVVVLLAKPSMTLSGAVASLVTAEAYSLATLSGAPVWARWVNGLGDWAMDTDAGGPGSGAEVEASDAVLLAGARVSITASALA